MPSPLRLSLLFAAAVALVLPASAVARDRVVTPDRTATNPSAFGQGLLWSQASGGRARLVLRGFGAPAYVPAPPRMGGLFDPDLGENAEGSVVAVYTRCAGVSGRNCDVYEWNFAQNSESKVAGASSSRCSEFAPSIWQGSVAFARTGPGDCAGLFVKGPRGAALRLDSRVPADTDIREGRVAYLHIPTPQRTVIRLFTIKEGKSRTVVSGLRAEGERTRVSSPVFGGSYLYFLFEDVRRKEFRVGRTRTRANATIQFSNRTLPRKVDSIAVDGRNVFYANGRGIFQATDPVPRFSARDI
jgi:hypothetical protein